MLTAKLEVIKKVEFEAVFILFILALKLIEWGWYLCPAGYV